MVFMIFEKYHILWFLIFVGFRCDVVKMNKPDISFMASLLIKKSLSKKQKGVGEFSADLQVFG
jgi:hypothetical protein